MVHGFAYIYTIGSFGNRHYDVVLPRPMGTFATSENEPLKVTYVMLSSPKWPDA